MQTEVDRLNRSMDSLKSSSARIVDLESEKEAQLQQINLLQKQLGSLKAERSRAEQLELDLLTTSNEIQKKNRSLDTIQKKLGEVEKDRTELENENSKVYYALSEIKCDWCNRTSNTLCTSNSWILVIDKYILRNLYIVCFLLKVSVLCYAAVLKWK